MPNYLNDNRIDQSMIAEMRNWIADCEWADIDYDEIMHDTCDADIIKGIKRHYDGGVEQFITDSN